MHMHAVRMLMPLEHCSYRRLRSMKRVHEILEVEVEAIIERDRDDALGKAIRFARKPRGNDCLERHDRNLEGAKVHEIVRERDEIVGRVLVSGKIAGVIGEHGGAHCGQNGPNAATRSISRACSTAGTS